MSETALSALAVALTGSDNEKKTSSLSTLKDELETLDELGYTTVVPLLKTALESSNGHVSLAALSCIPPMVKGMVTHEHQATLKQVVSALYAPASGSVMAFLGDSKPRVRETARSALCAATTVACEAHLHFGHPSRPNEVLPEIERIVKEQGFVNKTPRARVQILHYVRELRSKYPTVFQLKTYLPSMISLLEDSDASVRSSALETVIAVFQDPAIPSSARADLKNELTKQGIRKSSLDAILPKVFDIQSLNSSELRSTSINSLSPPTASASVQNHSDGQASITSPTTSALPPVDVPSSSILLSSSVTDGGQQGPVIQPVYITSGRELESEFAKMLPAWEGKETEHNWQAREGNVNTLRGMIKSGAHMQFTADFVSGLKTISDGLLKSLATLRTTMAVGTCNFLFESASLGNSFDPLLELFLPPLLRMSAQTKKIVFQASQSAATALIQSSSYNTRTLQYLWTCVNEKTIQARAAGICRIKEFLEVHGIRSRAQIESGGGLALIEQSLKKALADPSPGVRQTARDVYWTCASIWPSMTQALMETLDGATKKQLEKASHSIMSSTSSSKPSSDPPKRVSVRSLIKSTRTANRSTSALLSERPALSSSLRKSDTNPSSTPLHRSGLRASQPSEPKFSDNNYSNTAASPPHKSLATPPRQSPPNRSVRSSQPTSNNLAGSPLTKTTPAKSLTSAHRSLHTPQSIKLQSGTRHRPTSPSDFDPQSRLFTGGKGDEENVKPNHLYGDSSHAHGKNGGHTLHGEENIVEDAMKAQAEQAESAAHRLLELTEDEFGDEPLVPLGPGGVLLSNEPPSEPSSAGGAGSFSHDPAAIRQLNLAKLAKVNKLEDVHVWKKAFENSPAAPPISHSQSMGTDLRNRMRDSWWHRQAELTMCSAPSELSREEISCLVDNLNDEACQPAVDFYIKLAQCCTEHRCTTSSQPVEEVSTQQALSFWDRDRLFDRLFDGLRDRLREEASPPIRDSQLVLLRAVILHVGQLVTGKETELCTMLLYLACVAPSSVMIACEAIGLLWVEQADPIYGLSCLRSAVELISAGAEPGSDPTTSVRLAVTCVGEFFGRLPAEIVQEELPKARELIKQALACQHPETRMSAVMSLVAANEVMRDEKEVIKALGNDLTTAQEALLTYYLTPQHPTTNLVSASDG